MLHSSRPIKSALDDCKVLPTIVSFLKRVFACGLSPVVNCDKVEAMKERHHRWEPRQSRRKIAKSAWLHSLSGSSGTASSIGYLTSGTSRTDDKQGGL